MELLLDTANLEAIRKCNDDYRITAVVSVQQAFLAGSVGADYMAPYVKRMANLNIDPYEMGAEAVTVVPELLSTMCTNAVTDQWVTNFEIDRTGLYGNCRIYEL